MIFEDAFMEKQAEIIHLYKEAVSAEVDAIYFFLYNDEDSSLNVCFFQIGTRYVGNLEAGIPDAVIDEISDVICDEILPELIAIYQEYQKEMPAEYKLIYNTRTGAFDANYRYFSDLEPDYECGMAALDWINSYK